MFAPLKNNRKFLLATGGIFVVCFLVIGYIIGAIDYIPRLRASAQSPDGELTVEVYQQRISPRPFFARMGAFVRISDRNKNMLFEEEIYHDDDFDDTVGVSFKDISFEKNQIRIGPGAYDPEKVFAINRSDLPIKQ